MAGFIWALDQGHDMRTAAYIGCTAGLAACKTRYLVETGFALNDLLGIVDSAKEVNKWRG